MKRSTEPSNRRQGDAVRQPPERHGALSRWDLLMVARHEVPGIRPISDPSRRVRSDRSAPVLNALQTFLQTVSLGKQDSEPRYRRLHELEKALDTNHSVPYGTDRLRPVFQALRAWLPSLSPCGTVRRVAVSLWRLPHHGAVAGLLTYFALATSVSADPPTAKASSSPAPSPSLYTVINHVGEADQQVQLLEDKLLAHRRTIDPFGIAIRGKFKGLPPVEQHTPVTNMPAQAVKAVTNELTLDKAIQQLSVGAVNIANREALIGIQSIHEGDLLVLELSGHRFVVWVESIDRRGVQFCDITLQTHTLKRFRFGPTELPENSATGQTDVRDFLKEDGN